MGGVVADHQKIQQSASGHIGGEPPLMARNTQKTHATVTLRLTAKGKGPAWAGDLAPFVCVFHIVEGEHINVIGVEFAENVLQLRFSFHGGAGLELHANHDLLSPGTELRNGSTQ